MVFCIAHLLNICEFWCKVWWFSARGSCLGTQGTCQHTMHEQHCTLSLITLTWETSSLASKTTGYFGLCLLSVDSYPIYSYACLSMFMFAHAVGYSCGCLFLLYSITLCEFLQGIGGNLMAFCFGLLLIALLGTFLSIALDKRMLTFFLDMCLGMELIGSKVFIIFFLVL